MKPHIVLILADDYGWSNAGWHRANDSEVHTPVMDTLVSDGIELDRHYVFKFCSPSRSALQTGRNPTHVNVNNYMPIMHNPADPVSGYSAIPRNMTGLATLMRRAGYSTAMAGKWDAGQATVDHTPAGRGYERSLFYFNHCNDYWTGTAGFPCPSPPGGLSWRAFTKPANWSVTHTFVERHGYLAGGHDLGAPREATLPDASAWCAANRTCGGFSFRSHEPQPPASSKVHVYFKDIEGAAHFVADAGGSRPRDLYMDDGPAPSQYFSPQPLCSGEPYPAAANASTVCMYEDDVFARFLFERVEEWQEGKPPLFLFWAFHIAHSPYQVPKSDYDAFHHIAYAPRRVYAAMVAHMDMLIGRMIALLTKKQMLVSTLLVFSADNGGPITQAANNWPLRGSKHSNWDGGVRVNAWLSGGVVPTERRGTLTSSLVTLWDWYATLASIGGLSSKEIVDERAALAGLPPVDSIDQSSHLLGPGWRLEAEQRRMDSFTSQGDSSGIEGPLAIGATAPAERVLEAEAAPFRLSRSGRSARSLYSSPPRSEVALGSCANIRKDVFCQGDDPGRTTVSGLVVDWAGHEEGAPRALYKLLLGWVSMDCVTGPTYPNGTSTVYDYVPTMADLPDRQDCPWRNCGTQGCLYNLTADPTEGVDLLMPQPSSAKLAPLLKHMRARIAAYTATVFSPDRGSLDVAGACAAAKANGDVWVPWLP